MSYVLTKKGEQRIREFIKKCEEKRELILENGIDTANVEIVNEGDINIDLFFNNSPSKGENFQHAYPVTDHFAQDLVLEYEVDFFDSEKEEYANSILNVVEEFLNEKECEIPWQQSLLWMGMRNDESLTRKAYEDVWVNKAEWGNDTCWKGILPIRKWTELDVWLYTVWKKIPVNPKYKKGYSRVGCHCACPYYSKSTWILDKYWYPNGYQRWREILKKDFIENKKWLVMNCTLDEYLTQAWNGGTFRNVPTEQVIDEFAMYTGIHKEVAVQYFNKTCCRCGKTRIKQRDVLSMNLKLHGRNVNKFYCKKCLMEQYHWTSENWNQQVNAFKKQGCDLF